MIRVRALSTRRSHTLILFPFTLLTVRGVYIETLSGGSPHSPPLYHASISQPTPQCVCVRCVTSYWRRVRIFRSLAHLNVYAHANFLVIEVVSEGASEGASEATSEAAM